MPNDRVENQDVGRNEVVQPSANTADLLLDVWGPREIGGKGAQQQAESNTQNYRHEMASPIHMSQAEQQQQATHADSGAPMAQQEATARDATRPKEMSPSTDSGQSQGSPEQQQKPKYAPGAGGPADTKHDGVSPECIDWSKVPPIYMSF